MIIEKIQPDSKASLRLAINKVTNSFAKRGVSFIIQTESEFVGSLTIVITGKLGSATKILTIIYNNTTNEWEVYSDGYLYKLLALSELSTIVKTKVNKISTLLQRF